jgi:hypothetical protein
MVKKPTIILLVLFALMGAFVWFYELSPESQTAKITPEPTDVSRPFENWKFENTVRIDYLDENGATISVLRGKDMTNWDFDGNPSNPADTGKVFQLMSELLSLKPQVRLDTITELSDLGLDENSRKLTLIDSNGESFVILFGSETPTKSGTYIKAGNSFYIINTPVFENVKPLLTREGLLSPTDIPTLLTQTPSSQ